MTTSLCSIPFFLTTHTDYKDFSTSRVRIVPPANFVPEPRLSLEVNGDDVYEGDELIEVVLEYDLDLPKAFTPSHINETSEYRSMVDPPSTGSIGIDNRTAQIIIKEGNYIHTYIDIIYIYIYTHIHILV